jgi:GNAT superfamily N-acetyltransferase
MNDLERRIRLIETMPPDFGSLLRQVSQVSDEDVLKKAANNKQNYERLLRKDPDANFEAYFELEDAPGKAIGAIKYQAKPISVRRKTDDGLVLTTVQPYLEISDISVLPEARGQRLSGRFYNAFLDMIEKEKLDRLAQQLLVGAVGVLKEFYDQLYAQGGYSRDSTLIPKDVFGNRWALVESVRPETKGTEVYCNRLGLPVVGSSKRHGGPIYLAPLETVKGRRV